jgi:hypothetical protein
VNHALSSKCSRRNIAASLPTSRKELAAGGRGHTWAATRVTRLQSGEMFPWEHYGRSNSHHLLEGHGEILSSDVYSVPLGGNEIVVALLEASRRAGYS